MPNSVSGTATLSDDALIDAMMAHPILINRPLVVSPLRVKLCRPSESVLDLLPGRPGRGPGDASVVGLVKRTRGWYEASAPA